MTNIVNNWLHNVGLNHVVPTFESHGISNANDLVKLKLADYVSLGVVDSDDRKKLYYLIQRIKMEIGKESPSRHNKSNGASKVSQMKKKQHQQSDVELNKSRYTHSENSENNFLDTSYHQMDDSQKEPNKSKKIMRRSTRLQKLRESRECHVDLNGRLCKINSPSPSSPSKSPGRVLSTSNFDNDDISSPYYESKKTNPDCHESKDCDRGPINDTYADMHKGVYSMQHKSSSIPKSTMYDKENAQYDSLASTKGKSKRLSIEPKSKLYQMHNSPSKVDSNLQHAVLNYFSPGGPRKPKPNTTLPEINKSSKQVPKSLSKVSRKASLKTPYINQTSSTSSVSSVATASSASSRLSYSSRNKATLSKNTRKIKRLSTIPSQKELHMSPLAKISCSQFEGECMPGIVKIKENSLRSKSRERSSSRDRRRISAPIEATNTSIEHSRTQSHQQQSKLPAKVSNESPNTSRRTKSRSTSRQRCSSSSSRHSTGNYRMSGNKSVSSADSRRSNKSSASRIYSKNTNNNAPVFVHGKAVDRSWGTKVQQLREMNEGIYRKEANNQNQQMGEMRIRVAVRKRPVASDGEVDVIHPIDCDEHGKIICYHPKTRVDLTKEIETMKFSFDNVFDEHATNIDIYKATARDLIPGVFAGEWATVFAYGQTGSGKTFTMMGSGLTGMNAGNQLKNNASKGNLGLYYLAAQDLFHLKTKYPNVHIGASLFEIYSGKLYDLLNERKAIKCLEDHRGKVCFPGLSEYPVSNAHRLMEIIEAGATNRSTGSTSANADSSRSHAVLQLCLRKNVGKKQNVEHGRLTFIDLAGSERGADTYQASRTTRLEGAEINTSLLALKEVIRALATGDSMSHIPFRGSKLTQVLKQSFVGTNSRTVMIACVAPDIRHCEHTLNTLRYADRVKERNAETGKAAVDAMIYSKISNSPEKKDSHYQASMSTPNANKSSTVYCLDDIEDDHVQNESKYDWDNNDDWSFDGSEINDDNIHYKEASKRNDSLKLLANEVNSNDYSYTSSLASSPETKSKSAHAESHAVATKKKQPKEPFQATANKLIGTHRSITTSLLKITKEDMMLVNDNGITDRTEFDSYLNKLESLQVQQLDQIKELRETLVEFYSKRRSA